ncbi:conserved exported protein of unknown function [Candidatus Hydrogenisulfobacillus filiaventi]|uniref:Lipoprotein n=1 Tax=Candidatus Hydrogenisulfobacillus filiaventi TaxID=2707344 RepID=A0A6F8ZFU9_9FIRM|nr:conserved exported protein of unknown function [Candidatus Hydrogenisulfobacillus filiaventi]
MRFPARTPLMASLGAATVLTATLPACGTAPAAKPAASAGKSPAQPASGTRTANPPPGLPVPVMTSILTRSARIAAQEPAHIAYTLTTSNHTMDLKGTWAFDFQNQEAEGTDQGTFSSGSGAHAVPVTSRFIAIGNHVWGESAPPGVGWHEMTLTLKPPIPLTDLLPYYTDIHAIPGRLIDGHPTTGIVATLNQAGVNLMERWAAGQAASASGQVIQRIRFRIWIGTAHDRPREVQLTEYAAAAAGQPYQIHETARYYDWGQGLSLRPPAGG